MNNVAGADSGLSTLSLLDAEAEAAATDKEREEYID